MAVKIVNRILFGKKIKAYREKVGLTQYALAISVGITQNFLGDIERGNKLPSVEVLIRLSNVLKVSLDTLFAASLNNTIEESKPVIYTDKQLSVINKIIQTINENFEY
ncbi:MAG: helix-turn-helix transcriptional regulator [Clostridia bacterium]